MPNSSNAKVSPRKFSEKIALLVKKEAEGNAKFEEIIKEVQATRNQTGQARNSFSSRDRNVGREDTRTRSLKTSSDEIEEVYKDIIKFVGDYERALDSSRSDCENGNNAALSTFHESICDSTTLINENLVNVDLIQPHCVLPDQSSSLVDLNTLYQSGSYFPSKQDDQPSLSSLQSVETLATHQTNEVCIHRSRVTSMSSAHQRCSNMTEDESKQIQQKFDQEGDFFLKPHGYEKNWQKSCSDPSLSLASISVYDNGTTIQANGRVNQINCSVSTHVNLCEKYAVHMLDSSDTRQPSSDMITSFNFCQQKRDYSNDAEYAGMYLATQQAPIAYKMNTEIASSLKVEPFGREYKDPHLLTSLPGIKICSISDEAREKLDLDDPNDARNASRNRSLPDLQCNADVCLQQNNQAEDQSHGTTDEEHMLVYNSASIQPNCMPFGSMHDTHEQSPEAIQPVYRASSACSNLRPIVKPYPLNRTSYNTALNIDTALSNSTFSNSYPRIQYECASNGSLSVGTSIIGDELGLVHSDIRNVQLFHNIMRSRSHGGIDNITKKMSNKRLFDGHTHSQRSSVHLNDIIDDSCNVSGTDMCYTNIPEMRTKSRLENQESSSINTNQLLDHAAQPVEFCLRDRADRVLDPDQTYSSCKGNIALKHSVTRSDVSGKLNTLSDPLGPSTVPSGCHTKNILHREDLITAHFDHLDSPSSSSIGFYESPTKNRRR